MALEITADTIAVFRQNVEIDLVGSKKADSISVFSLAHHRILLSHFVSQRYLDTNN